MAAIPASEPSLWRMFEGRYGHLLASLLFMILLAPWLSGENLIGGLIDLLICFVMLTGIYAASPRRRSLAIGFLLTIATLASHREVTLFPRQALFAIHYLLMLSVLIYATVTILSAIIRHGQVTIDTIKAAICVYLLLGLVWVVIFALIDVVLPGSFRLAEGSEAHRHGDMLLRHRFCQLLYFSYATLTTLGYGDIVPRTPPAQTSCYLEAVVGQLYLAVLIARLVGMHISQPPGNKPKLFD